MKEIDWEEAPEWANAVIASSGEGTSRFWWVAQWGGVSLRQELGYDFNGGIADMSSVGNVWVLVEERPSKAWDGKGNPQVGTVCELRTKTGGWGAAEIKYISSTVCVWLWIRYDGGVQSLEYTEVPWKLEFRPLKTQEQIAAEEREKAIHEMWMQVTTDCGDTIGIQKRACADLYDAGYRLTKTEE